MADNETPSYPAIVVQDFTGVKLRNGQFAEYIQDILAAIGNDAPTLFAENIVPVLEALKASYLNLVRFPFGFNETAQIVAKDEYRDKLARLLIVVFKRYLAMPSDSPFWTHANSLYEIVSRYYDIGGLSITEQTSLIRELCETLTAEANAAHVTALGLTALVTELNTVNTAVRTLFRARTMSSGKRTVARGGKSVRDIRIEIGEAFKQLCVIINGAYALQPSEITQNIMSNLTGIVNKYKAIAASNSTTPENGEDEEPDPTPTPDPDEGGGESDESEGGGETPQVTEG